MTHTTRTLLRATLRLGALVVGVLAILGVLAPAALASGASGRIDHVETSADGTVRVLFSVPGLPSQTTIDPSTIGAWVNGQKMHATAQLAKSSTNAIRRVAILAIDVSDSMHGAPFTAAKQAARAYITHAPSDVYIGIVTFADKVTTAQAPTQNRGALLKAVGGLSLSLHTRLYDGVAAAINLAGSQGSRSILLLSDGVDTTGTPLGGVLQTAHDSGVRIDAVALNQQLVANSPLEQIVAATQGTVTSSGTAQLQQLFTSEADVLAKQLQVTFALPTSLSGASGNLKISVQAGGSTYTDEAFVSFTGISTNPTTVPQYPKVMVGHSSLSKSALIGGLLLVFLALAVLLAYGLTGIVPAELSPMQKQLNLYTVRGMRRSDAKKGGDPSEMRKTAVGIASQLMSKRDFEEVLSSKLQAGGMHLTPAEWLLVHVGVAIAAGLAGLLLFHGSAIAMTVLLAAGILLPWVYLSLKRSRRVKAFNGQLAPTLQIMAGGLQAGLSLPQAVDTVVQEGSDPMAAELKRTIVEQRLGVEIEDSLDGVADRMESLDFKWVVMAIRIQREVGGNLSELLLTVSATLREREYLRRQVNVLSAEGRLSAWILGLLPPLFVGYLALARPTYLAPMFHNTIGWVMWIVATVAMTIGVFWLKKAVKVEV